MTIPREVKLLLSSVVLLALAAVLVIQYTDVCRLQAVTLNGQPVDNWDQKLGLRPGQTLIRQPVDSLADRLLSRQGITRVEIEYRLPGMLKISTNNLDPVCYLLDRTTGLYFGLDESGRVVPVDVSQSRWEMPILTGLRVRHLHETPDDYRADMVVAQILEIRRTNQALYRSIDQIDFTQPNFVTVLLTDRRFALRVPADQMLQRFRQFDSFLSRFNPPLDSASCFDMTYDDEIIRIGSIPKKVAPKIDTASVNDLSDFSDEEDLTPAGTVEVPARRVQTEATTERHTEVALDSAPQNVKASGEKAIEPKPAPAKKNAAAKTGTSAPTRTTNVAPVRNSKHPGKAITSGSGKAKGTKKPPTRKPITKPSSRP